MTDLTKATRAPLQVGPLTVDGFMLPDGTYCMSQTQVAEAVGLTERNARDFLQSKALKSLLGEGYTDAISQRQEVEMEGEAGKRGASRFIAMPLEVVTAYWLWQAFRSNKQALALCMALMTESLERRFDVVFGVERSPLEYNDRTTQRIQELERDLEKLGEAYAVEDSLKEENDRFLRLLREQGIDPYALSGDE